MSAAVYDPEEIEKKEETAPGSGPKDSSKDISPNQLNKSEQDPWGEPTKQELGKFANMRPSALGVFSFAKKNRGKLIIGGIGASFITLIIIGFFFLLPFKILHIVNNIQSKMFGTTQNAMDKETDRLFTDYVKKQIKFAQLGNCKGKRIDSSCNPFNGSDSLVYRLYKGWSNGRLEEKLYTDYGIGVRRVGSGFHLEYQGDDILDIRDNVINGPDTIDDILRSEGSFKPATRSEIRQAFRDAFEKETRAKKVMYYIKVGKLLESKYGIKRCLIACKTKDNFADWKDNKKRAAKVWLVQRVLVPKLQIYQLLYACMLSENCSKEAFTHLDPGQYVATDAGCVSLCDLNGEATSIEDRKIRSEILQKLLAAYGGDVASMLTDYKNFERNGLRGFLQRGAKSAGKDTAGIGKNDLGNLGGTQAFKDTVKYGVDLVPVVGQINRIANIINNTDAMVAAIPKMAYVMNSTAAAAFFTMYRTAADETKDPGAPKDAALIGSLTDSLGPGIQIDSDQKDQIGGLAEAENTPLYNTLIGNPQANTKFASVISSIISPKAMAAAPPYTCADGNPVQKGINSDDGIVCRETEIRQPGGAVNKGAQALFSSSNPYWSALTEAAGLWKDARTTVVGLLKGILDSFGGFVCGILNKIGLCDALENAAKDAAGYVGGLVAKYGGKYLQEAIQYIMEKIFGFNVDQITDHISGGRAFDMLVAGADVAGNAFAHNGLGGRILTAAELLAIQNQESDKKIAETQGQSFFARMFDQNNDNSFISRLAMSLPTNKSVITQQSLASFLTRPLSILSNSFGSIFTLGRAGAEAPPTQVISDPFGLDQYGYPVNDPVFREDPDTFWTQHCVGPNSLTAAYNKYAADPAHVDDTYTGTNTEPDATASGAALKAAYMPTDGEQPTGTDGCLLLQAAAGSAGALYTNDVLSPDEISSLNAYKAIAQNEKGGTDSNFAFVGMGLAQ